MLKACRWQGELDTLPREVSNQDLSSNPAVLQQIGLAQARLGQLSGLPGQEGTITASRQCCED